MENKYYRGITDLKVAILIFTNMSPEERKIALAPYFYDGWFGNINQLTDVLQNLAAKDFVEAISEYRKHDYKEKLGYFNTANNIEEIEIFMAPVGVGD